MMDIIRIVKKFGQILSSHQKMRVIELGILMLIGGILETCSVSLVLPFMDAVINLDNTMNKPYVKWVYELLGVQSPRLFLVLVAIALAILYVLKNLYLMFEYSIQNKYVFSNMFAMQSRLLNTFLYRPYEYFLKVNSGEIMRIINEDVRNAFNLLTVLLSMFTELVVSVMLIITTFVIAPMVTLCIALILFILLILTYVVIKPRLRKAGLSQQKAVMGMNKWLLQSIQGIKELKVMKKEEFFEKKFDKNGQTYVKSLHMNQTLTMIPRYTIEGLCMGVMFIVTAVLIYNSMELTSIVPMLTAAAMAGIRLIPSVNRLSSALSQVAYGEPMVDKVIENLSMIESEEPGQGNQYIQKSTKASILQFRETLILDGVTYHYPGAKKYVLENVSVEIKKGDSIGIVGTSGSGKTTTVDIILGLLTPQAGRVLIDGVNIEEDIAGWMNQIGYIPQMIFMLDDSIRANIAFGANVQELDDENIWRALKEASLYEFVRSLPEGIETQIGERGVRLSGGQRQRIGIARALYRNPEILIFDEATSALDSDTETAIMESIHSLHGHKTMIIIAHRLSTLVGCDYIFRVDNGKIIKE